MSQVAGTLRVPSAALAGNAIVRGDATARGARLLLCAALFASTPPLFAQTEPLARRPYELHLVILLAEHRFLSTELFQDQFPNDLARQTKLALGALARVDAATAHPLAEAIRRDGLDTALDGYEEVSQRRTWFFTVEFRDGQFHLRGRFFDGLTGLPGPPARRATTSDRGRLAHLAARMVAERFPLVGTVTRVQGANVDLALLGGPIDETAELRPGAVFALSRIAVESGKARARRLAWAVLETRAPPAAGVVSCRFWHRFQDELAPPADGVVYRALLLPTRSAPLKLQVLDKDTAQPLAGLGVKIHGGARREIDLVTDAAGMVVTPEKIAGLALVKLSQGGAVLAQFPAPIVDDRVLVCAVSDRPDAEDRAGLEIRRQQLVKRLLDTLQVVDLLFGEQRILLSQSLEKSLEHAKKTRAFLDAEIAAIRDEREEIQQLAAKKKPAVPRREEGEKGLARLKDLRAVVSDSIGRIAQAIADRDRQTEKQGMAVKLVEQAALLESQAQYDEAIELYQKAVLLLPEPGTVGERLASLRAAWEVKNEAHRQARKFLVETWPKVDVALLKDHLVGAEKSLDVCRVAGDRLTPRRFLLANVDHLAGIARIVETLHRSRAAEDRKRLQAWNETVATLRRLSSQAIEQVEPPAHVEKSITGTKG